MVLRGQISIMIIFGICASALQATSLLDQHGRSSSDETDVCKEACHRTFTAGSLSGKVWDLYVFSLIFQFPCSDFIRCLDLIIIAF